MPRKHLWPLLGTGIESNLAKVATDFFEEHGRPIRIAVDVANVGGLKCSLPSLYRLCAILRLNIHLLMVFDGPKRFAEKGKSVPPQHEIDAMKQGYQAFKKLLDHLGIPHHDAPADAEAECVALQLLQVVDATWSKDCDCALFGSPFFIFNGPGSWDSVRVIRLAEVTQRTGMTRKGLTLYGLLTGNDYGSGLLKCSLDMAFTLATEFPELRESLFSTTEETIADWRAALADAIYKCTATSEDLSSRPRTRSHYDFVGGFPTFQYARNCFQPIVSEDAVLTNLPCLVKGWVRLFDNTIKNVCDFLNVKWHAHPSLPRTWPMKLLVPIEVNNRLLMAGAIGGEGGESSSGGVERKPGCPTDLGYPTGISRLGIMVKRRGKRANETSVTINPQAVFSRLFPNVDPNFLGDPLGDISFRLLDCVLQAALPAANLEENQPLDEANTSDEEERDALSGRRNVLGPAVPSVLGKRKLRSSSGLTPTQPTKKAKTGRVRARIPNPAPAPAPAAATPRAPCSALWSTQQDAAPSPRAPDQPLARKCRMLSALDDDSEDNRGGPVFSYGLNSDHIPFDEADDVEDEEDEDYEDVEDRDEEPRVGDPAENWVQLPAGRLVIDLTGNEDRGREVIDLTQDD